MILLDTNILLRLIDATSTAHETVISAIQQMHFRKEVLCIVPQNLYEFWAVATRPLENNGLGLSTNECDGCVTAFRRLYDLLPDGPTVFPNWNELVISYQCRGKSVHDARLVAAMLTHGISSILTMNAVDFRRYKGIEIIEPGKL